MHWIWRMALSMVVTCILASPFVVFVDDVFPVVMSLMKIIGQRPTVFILGIIPSMLCSMSIYGLLTRYCGPEIIFDGETRCRKCQYILKGITEPRCPECGERI